MPCHGKIVVIKRSGADGTHFSLTAATCLFGRKSECDIRIQLPHVSKEHCKVEVRKNGEVFLTNLSSVNPTQLNGNVLKQPARLKHGDIITIIDRSFRFESPQLQQGRRRSAGLDSENFKLFASKQSEDTNETVRLESITTSKAQRKSEGNIIRTTHTRRSLQPSSSSESKKDQSPFGELYEMFKSKVESRKKENSQTPVKESNSPKNVNVKRNFQAEAVSSSPATSRRDSRRSQSSATVRSKDTKVESPRAVSADRAKEQSKSPVRVPRNSLTKQTQGSAVEVNSPVVSKSTRNSSVHEATAQDHVQTPRRRSGKEEQEAPVSLEKQSPRRSRGAEKNQAVDPVTSPGSSRRASRGQSVPPVMGIENQENSPLPVQSPKGRRSGSKEQTKGTPTKPAKEDKVNERAQGHQTKSPKKRRSDDLGLVEPPLKRKRVSFGGHLSPELFDKRLPPNSPLKKGATPARRSLSLNSPRTVIRKSFGLKQTSIKEVFEFSADQSVRSPLARTTTPTRRASSSEASQILSGGSPASSSVSSPNRRSSAVNKKSPSKSPLSVAITPAKQSPNKRSPSKTLSLTPLRNSPSKTPVKRTPVKPEPTSSSKRSSLSNVPASAKKSPVKSLPSTPVGKSSDTPSTTPAKRSSSTRSPSRSPISVKKSPIKSEATTPAKMSTPTKRSPGRPPSTTPAKKSPKLSTPGKSTVKSPSTSPAKKSPAKLSTPGKKSPGRPLSASPAKSPVRSPSKSPVKKSPAKLSTPAKKSPVRSPSKSPAKKSPAKLSTPAKRSPGRPPSTTLARKSPAKLATPGKTSPGKSPARKSPVAKSPRTPVSVKVTKSPASTKKSVSRSPANRSPSTPYTKGRFSISRVATPPQAENVSNILASQTPKQSRKSLTSKKTPHRRSRKLEAFEVIRAKRRSGASEANLFVAKSWADVVKIGVAKHHKKSVSKPTQKTVATKKKPKPKTPARRLKDLSSTGHADSPATILVGKAHSRTLDLTGYVPKVVRNQAVKLNPAHNESFTGMAELFSTPENAKQRRSSRFDGSKTGTPKSTVELSVMQTPEEAGEMVVSPLNSAATTQRKRFGRDAVSRLLEVPVSPELSTVAISEKADQEASKSKDNRKSVGLTGVKRIMRTPKQKGKPVTDPHALKKLLKTPKETESTQAHTRRSVNLEVLGIAQLMKTPKHKGQPVEDLTGVKRIMKTPKQRGEPVADMMGITRIMKTPRQKGEPVDDYSAIKHIMRTPKERAQPVEDMIGIKRLMRTPKVRGEAVEDMVGIKRIMRTPKVRGQPAEDIDISHLMSTPAESTHSTENTRPIEEIFGIKNLVKTPPKKPAVEQALAADLRNATEALKPLGSSNTPVKRGRQSKRLSLPAETATTVNEVQKTMQVAEIEIAQESGAHSISEVIKSAQKKKGRPSKNVPVLPASEATKESTVPEVTSPSQRGRPRATIEVPKEPQVTEVTSPSRRGRPRSIVLSPVADKAPVQANEGSTSQVQTESASEEVLSPSRRGRPRSTPATPKDSVIEVTSPTRRGRPSTAVATETPASAEVATSPTHGGRRSTTLKAADESHPPPQMTSPSRRGRPSNTLADLTSPTRSGRLSKTSEMVKQPVTDSTDKITSPKSRGRPSTGTLKEPIPNEKLASPSPKGRTSTTTRNEKDSNEAASAKITSPTHRGRQSTTAEAVNESNKTSDAKMASPSRGGKLSTSEEPKVSLSVSDAKAISPKHRGRSIEVAKESMPVTEIASPSRRGRSVESAKESVPVANKIASPSRRGRQAITEVVPKELDAATDGKVKSTRGRPQRSEASKEPASVPAETLQTRRGRSKDPVEVPKDSVPVKSAVTSPAHGKPSKSTVEVPKQSSVDKETTQTHEEHSKSTVDAPKEQASEVTSPRRGRPKASVELAKEPVVVTVEASTTRRGRSKISADVPEKLADVSQTRRGRTKTKADQPEEPVPASSGDVPSTRRGRAKTAAVVKESVPEDSVAASPARRGRPKTTDIPKEPVVAASDVTAPARKGQTQPSEQPKAPEADVSSPARRGRPKLTDIPKEPVPAESDVTSPTRRGRPKTVEPAASSDVTSPTRRGRSKTMEVPKAAEANDASLPTRRGRPKATDAAEKPVSVSDNEVTSPTRSDRLQNREAPKEPSVVAASPKARGRPARSTEKTEVSPSETLAEANKVTNKRAAQRQAAKGSKQNVEEQPQEAQVSQPVESNTTAVQPPVQSQRGRGRKAVQNEQPTASKEPQSISEDSQKAEFSVTASPSSKPIARRGRRRNEQLADVASSKPDELKLEPRRRGQSKNIDETAKETVNVPDQANSPAAKSVRGSAKQPKDTQPGAPVEELTKRVRGRASRNAQKDNSTETSTSDIAASPRRTPTKGGSRTRDASDASVEEKEQPETKAIAPVSKRGRRKIQESTNESLVQTEPTETSRATRGKRGLPDSEQPQPAAEIKGRKTARSKDSGEKTVIEERQAKAKSVQWHPLLTTDVNAESTEKVEETTIEASARGSRSKGRTKPDTSEATPAKRARIEASGDTSEPPTVSKANTSSSVADVSVKGRRGRKAAAPQEQLEDKSSDAQSSSDETARSSTKPAVQQTRGRKAAASSKASDSENNEVAEVLTSRGRRGAAASIVPAESISQSPAKSNNHKDSDSDAESVATKPARGGRRKNANTETPSTDTAKAKQADAENVPAVRGKRTGRSTKAGKGEHAEESLVEQIVSSPAKRRKIEAATSGTSTKEAAKPGKVKSPVATRGRASTRSRK